MYRCTFLASHTAISAFITSFSKFKLELISGVTEATPIEALLRILLFFNLIILKNIINPVFYNYNVM